MIKRNRLKQITSALGLLAASGVAVSVATLASSCATVDSNVFRTITLEDIEANKQFQELNQNNYSTAKNLIYGTKSYNNGNYVLLLGTYSDQTQWTFLHGTNGQASTDSWLGNYGLAIRQFLNDNTNPVTDLYPSGIGFTLFLDTYMPQTHDTSNRTNPFARYREVDSDNEIATQQQKDNSKKYRREDTEAVQYRDLANLMYSTYSNEQNTVSWLSTNSEYPTNTSTDGTIPDAEQDIYSQITKIMAIAFRQDKDGNIQRAFYADSTGDTGEGEDSGDSGTEEGGDESGDTSTDGSTTPATQQIEVSIRSAIDPFGGSSTFFTFLRDFYLTND